MGHIPASVFEGLGKGLDALHEGMTKGAAIRGQFVVDIFDAMGQAYPFLVEWSEDIGEYAVIRPSSIEELDLVMESQGLSLGELAKVRKQLDATAKDRNDLAKRLADEQKNVSYIKEAYDRLADEKFARETDGKLKLEERAKLEREARDLRELKNEVNRLKVEYAGAPDAIRAATKEQRDQVGLNVTDEALDALRAKLRGITEEAVAVSEAKATVPLDPYQGEYDDLCDCGSYDCGYYDD